jgi:benzoyl-CoA reductase/2-hydroxyglutaryl-CoA dehydratase subunit BcrC/BadD/HgdB
MNTWDAPKVKCVIAETINTLPRRSVIAREQKRQGGMVAAVLPIHYSRALLRAFNILPIEVWGPPNVDASHGAAHLQPYVCSIARNALSFLLSGGLDIADMILVPHACDTLQGFASVLLDFVHPSQPVIPLYLPRGNTGREIEFLAEELKTQFIQLEKITQRTPTPDELLVCIAREEAADDLLAQLHKRRNHLEMGMPEFYRLVRSREYLPAETFAELVEPILVQRSKSTQEGIPILLSGIVPEPMQVFQAIAELGGRIVADDLACCGRRLYPKGNGDDPFKRIADRLLGTTADWNRGSPIQARIDHLRDLAQTSGARGVIFYNVKFCEPELFDLPGLRKGLQQVGLPSVLIEIDLNDPLSQQTLTRIEAFLEMIA